MAQLLHEYATAPDGTRYSVSTVSTVAGGSKDEPATTGLFNPLNLKPSDFDNLTAWPFETMVFPEVGSTGLYHAPYADERAARAGHAQVVEAIKAGSEWAGGVEGPFGTPSVKAADWLREHGAVRQ